MAEAFNILQSQVNFGDFLQSLANFANLAFFANLGNFCDFGIFFFSNLGNYGLKVQVVAKKD